MRVHAQRVQLQASKVEAPPVRLHALNDDRLRQIADVAAVVSARAGRGHCERLQQRARLQLRLGDCTLVQVAHLCRRTVRQNGVRMVEGRGAGGNGW